jgi:hypothetical protein
VSQEPRTNGERLARIETILERIDTKLDLVETGHRADVADLAQLKNRGFGILIGVALAAGSAGAGMAKLWQSLTG